MKLLLVLSFLATVFSLPANESDPTTVAEAKAVRFLMKEVPAWSMNNGCFSCHNNGDAARALYAASRKGYVIPESTLGDATAWVMQPGRWDDNKGDPGFSDKRLADIQFAASLLAAVEAGHIKKTTALKEAARRVVKGQGKEGAWKIDAQNPVGSPATYGTDLATYMAVQTLRKANSPEVNGAVQKAEAWFRTRSPNSTLTAAVIVLALGSPTDAIDRTKQEDCLKRMRAAQTRDGGWGPYADSPAEPFDTAVVLLALLRVRQETGVEKVIERGRAFLVKQQNPDGSWPATTRPPGGESYAQQLSTTGWATLALLETRK
jgi:hypothetical protein